VPSAPDRPSSEGILGRTVRARKGFALRPRLRRALAETSKTCTVTYTDSRFQERSMNQINEMRLQDGDLKFADPKGLWGFESPSRHHDFGRPRTYR